MRSEIAVLTHRRVRNLLALPGIAIAAIGHAGCIEIAVTSAVDGAGALEREVSMRSNDILSLRKVSERFQPPWRVSWGADGKQLTASLSLPPLAEVPGNATELRVERIDRLLFTEYHYREDFTKVDLRPRQPAPALHPGLPLLPWLRVLADDASLALIERLARSRITIALTVSLPGRIIGGNFTSRSGKDASWQFDFRSLQVTEASSRLYHPGRIAALFSALAAIAALLFVRVRAARRSSSIEMGGPS